MFVGKVLPKRKDVIDGYKPLSKAKIDSKLRALISDLNEKGYVTTASCQGRTVSGDSHLLRAHIMFNRRLSTAFAHQCKNAGLLVFGLSHYKTRQVKMNGEFMIVQKLVEGALSAIGTDVWENTPESEAIAANSTFITKVRELFDLPEGISEPALDVEPDWEQATIYRKSHQKNHCS